MIRVLRTSRDAQEDEGRKRAKLQRLANGNAQADVARAFNVSQATISRLASL
jgi:DNA-binding transcriptional regulator LsrR (DeoR family)